MLTDDRKLALRRRMWDLARGVLTDAAHARTAMPDLVDEEYAYARDFMLGIAKSTRPGGYAESEDEAEGLAQDEVTRSETSRDRTSRAADVLRSTWANVSIADLHVAIAAHRANCHEPSCPVLAAMEVVAAEAP